MTSRESTTDIDVVLFDEVIVAKPGPNDVVFTQYLRPHGRPVCVWIERPSAVVEMASRLVASGYHFDIEELMDGHVSMTVEQNTPNADGEDQPIAQELCPNGPDVPVAVDRLITRAIAVIESEAP